MTLTPAITDPNLQARTLAGVAKAGAGDSHRAEALARAITDPDLRARTLADLAAAVAGGDPRDGPRHWLGGRRRRPGRSPTRTGRRERSPVWQSRWRRWATRTGPRHWLGGPRRRPGRSPTRTGRRER